MRRRDTHRPTPPQSVPCSLKTHHVALTQPCTSQSRGHSITMCCRSLQCNTLRDQNYSDALRYSYSFQVTVATGAVTLLHLLSATFLPHSQKPGCPFNLLYPASSRFLYLSPEPGGGHNDRQLSALCSLRLSMLSPTIDSSSPHRRHVNLAIRCLCAKPTRSLASNRNSPSLRVLPRHPHDHTLFFDNTPLGSLRLGLHSNEN
ncbi:hypothetical protein BU25DRAFT_229278 [Macroventuria anomochaeta]|uniref:Uncharacterized protein n=1 Tax=Macroventuria anomochaeta TaxID=301207 RepID=A0ACB6RL47_9PLEO|nr:uncharacterized protein BU25DRAFT_229278 [Macroventuria anomochaeta]KAF2621884.1 hypothetical protein BU25DRAFT_229278 [Macroventuria anomochaeta]